MQDYSASNKLLWTPSTGGAYRIQVWARYSGSPALYNAYSSVVSFSITSNSIPVVTNLSASVTLPAPVGVPMTWTATATGGTPPLQYAFYVAGPSGNWVLAQGYSASNTLMWTPNTAGGYRIQVWARNSGSTAMYDAVSSVVTFTITDAFSPDGN
jgi:hypothetical protein